MYTNGSNIGIGAVQSQIGVDGIQHPILCFSRKLVEREQHLSAIEKEVLAIAHALGKLKPYI